MTTPIQAAQHLAATTITNRITDTLRARGVIPKGHPMSKFQSVDEYRDFLASIESVDDLTADCLGAVVEVLPTGGGEMTTGTLVAVRHELAPNLLFGGMMVDTYVKLCTSCVHEPGADCAPVGQLDWQLVLALGSIARNGEPQLKGATAGEVTS